MQLPYQQFSYNIYMDNYFSNVHTIYPCYPVSTLPLPCHVRGRSTDAICGKGFCLSDHARSRRCRRSRRSIPPRNAIPNPARPLLAQNSFLLLAVATFVPDSRCGAGEGTARLQTRVSRPKSVTLHNDESPDRQKAKTKLPSGGGVSRS